MKSEFNSNQISAFTNDVLGKRDAVELSQLISKKEIQIKELVEAAIQRAETVNPFLNGITTKMYETARKEAEEKSEGFFSGIPSFIKDNENVKGFPTSFGSLSVSRKSARRNSPFVEQLKALGFINIGKSALCEFGLTATTESSFHGQTRNPWNREHSTGGSSGGAAALVAAGVVPLAHANDGGGSIRIPAASCGLIGLKPSRGRFQNEKALSVLPLDIVHQGLVSRTVRDTTTFYSYAEKYYKNPQLPEIGSASRSSLKRLRMGFFYHLPFLETVDPEVVNVLKDSAKICSESGHSVEEIPCPFSKEVGDDFFLYWGMMAFLFEHLGGLMTENKYQKEKLEYWTRKLSENFFRNLWQAPFMFYRLKKFYYEYEKVFQKYDILLSPVMAHPAPKLGYLSTTDVVFEEAYRRVRQFVPYTPIHNVSGAPAISLPMGFSSQGLPIGMQFSAAYGEDRLLLDLAFELEEAASWKMISDIEINNYNRI